MFDFKSFNENNRINSIRRNPESISIKTINGYNDIDRTGISQGKIFLSRAAILGPQIESLNMIYVNLRTPKNGSTFENIVAKDHN